MATYSKEKLSGSTNGKQIKVAATSSTGTTIHTAQSGSTYWDEIWIYATNTSTSSVKLTIEWGETAVDGNIEITIPGESGYNLIIPGMILQDSLVVTAFAGTTNVININGYVNRISA